jgi:hypothetical protein
MAVIFDPILGQLRTKDSSGSTSPLTTKGDIYTYSTTNDRLPVGVNGTVLSADSTQATGLKWIASGGTGTVTSVSVTTANGVSGTVANATTTPAISLTLGAITPTSVNSVVLSGSTTPTLAVTGTSSISGANTGDQTITLTGAVTGSGTGSFATTVVTNANLTGDVTSVGNATTLTNAPVIAKVLTGYVSGAGVVAATDSILQAIQKLNGNDATNANLTGVITSSGNATSIASQTGTGTKFVVDNSPTLTGTPAAPTAAAGDSTTQLATTAFVQMAVRSVPSKEASKYATTAALATVTYYNGVSNDGVGATLTGVGLGAITLDGNTPIVGDRLLVKNQVSTFQNGIYTVTIVGTAGTVFVITRALDFNQTGDIKTGATTYVTSGATLAATTWDVNSADSPVMGTDAITFIQSAGPGSLIAGTGIGISGVTVAIDTSVTVDKTTVQTLTNKTLTSPTLTTPTLGVATATSINKVAFTAPTTAATFAFGTDNTTQTFQGTDTIVGRATTDTLTNKTLTTPVINQFGTASGLGAAWTSFTPTWTALGTSPALGNGTLTGFYTQIGKLVSFRVRFVAGSTTTFGTSQWNFALPVTANADVKHATGLGEGIGTWYAENPGVVGYGGTTVIAANSTTNFVLNYTNSTVGGQAQGNYLFPGTWANTWYFLASGTYEAA